MFDYYIILSIVSLVLLSPVIRQAYIELTESDREALWRIYCDDLGYDPIDNIMIDFSRKWNKLRLHAIPREPPHNHLSGF